MQPPEPTEDHRETAALPALAALPAPAIGWNLGIRLPGRRYYLNLRVGAEQRSPQRLAAEGQVRVPVALTAYVTAGTVLSCLFGLMCFLYLLKSMAGINLFPGTSPLHPIYALFFE